MGPRREWCGVSGQGVTFSDGATFSDGSTFAAGGATAAAMSLRATSGVFSAPGAGGEWTEGRFFGLRGRLYQVTDVLYSGDHEAEVEFWPPLRAAAAAGEALDYPPASPMKLVENDAESVMDEPRGAVDLTLRLEEKEP